jgi:hypothetical protein
VCGHPSDSKLSQCCLTWCPYCQLFCFLFGVLVSMSILSRGILLHGSVMNSFRSVEIFISTTVRSRKTFEVEQSYFGSRNSSVGIASGLQFGRFLTGSRDVSLLHNVQTGSGPPIQWIPGAVCLGLKRQRREADHSSI